MAVLRSYAPWSLRVCGPLPQQPLWLRHRARGGPSRPDNWGMFLCKPVGSTSARAQYYLPVAGNPSLAMKKLQLPARAQGRAFSGHGHYCWPKDKLEALSSDMVEALEMMKQHHRPFSFLSWWGRRKAKKDMVAAIDTLEELAADEHHCGNSSEAHKLLSMALLPLSSDVENHHLKNIVEASLRATCLLLKNAPVEIRSDLRRTISLNKQVKTNLEKIRDSAHKAGPLAHKILAQLP